MLLDNIAALAAAAHHRGLEVALLIHFISQQAGIVGFIQRIAWIIRHAAVNGDIVFIAGDLLHRATGIQRHACRAHNAAAGLHMDLRHFNVQPLASRLDGCRHLTHLGVHIQEGITLDIADAIAAAQIQLLRHIAVLFLHSGNELQHNDGRALKNILTEYLGTHMAVEAHQLHMGLGQGKHGDLLRLSGLHGRAELTIHLAGGNGLIGMGINARGQAQQHLLPDAPAASLGLNGLDFLHIVRYKVANMVIHTVHNIPIGLIVAVEVGVGQIVARLQGGVDLAGGYHIDAHALLLHDLVDALEGVGLAGIQGAAGGAEMLLEGILIHAALMADIVFIQQIQRCAVLLSQGHCVLAGKVEVPIGSDSNILTDHSDILSFSH